MSVKVGDLIRMDDCTAIDGGSLIFPCGCPLCANNSSRIGLVVAETEHSDNWSLLFDFGEIVFYLGHNDFDVISAPAD